MNLNEFLPITGFWWSDLLLGLVLALILLYLARQPVHDILTGSGRILGGFLRMAAGLCRGWQRRLARLGRHALFQLAREHQERISRRQLRRLDETVETAVAEWPALESQIQARLQRIESDYRDPPEPPNPPTAWADLLKRITSVSDTGDPAVARAVEAVTGSIEETSRQMAQMHEQSSSDHHRTLETLRPEWEGLARSTREVRDGLETLRQELADCRRRVQRFDTLQNQRGILTSRLKGWLALHFMVGIAMGGLAVLVGLVNFHLVALPMQEALGAGSRIGPWPTASVAAVTLTLLQAGLAVVITDSAGITRLIAPIGQVDAGRRRIVLGIASISLILLCLAEAGMAFIRDSMILEQEWLARELEAGIATGEPGLRWVPSLAQMVMGFVLPLSFLVLAPGVESLLQAGRVVLIWIGSGLTTSAYLLFRFLARGAEEAARLLAYGYDLVIFLPLAVERAMLGRRQAQAEDPTP